tara:strand:+ start:3162 stop:3374 length:213 start_codon:yes stop_codon:yes gene_type:complete
MKFFFCESQSRCYVGGGGGIRTPERVAPLPVFKTGAFNHSATPPKPQISAIFLRYQQDCSAKKMPKSDKK